MGEQQDQYLEQLKQKPVRVLGLHIENYKRIELADLFPEKRVTVLAGPNGSGKSSIGDAFVSAIGGKRVRPPEMLRKGAEEGRSVVDIGNDDAANTLHVELVFTSDGRETYEVTNADGVPMRAPQELMNSLIGPQRSQFDPMALLDLPKRDFANHLSKSIGLDFTELDQEWQKTYDERHLIGRELTSAKARLAAMPRPSDNDPEPINTTQLLKQQEELLDQQRERNALASAAREAKTKLDAASGEFRAGEVAIAKIKADLAAAEETVRRIGEELKNAELHLEAVSERGKKLKEECRVARVKSEQAPDPDMDLTMLRSKLEEAEKHTEAALKQKERVRVAAELKSKEDEHALLEKKLAGIEAKKTRLIAEAKFPLEGLSFTRTGEVTFKGLPFEQASQADQLRAVVAIGLASKPLLRTMWIKEGTRFDRTSLGLLYDALEEFDGQALVEWARDIEDIRGPCVVVDAGHIVEVRKS